MLPEETRDLFLFLNDAASEPRILDVITRSGVAMYCVITLVQAAFERHAGRTFLRPAFYKIVLFIVERVEKRPRDRLDDRRFPRTVLARDRGRTALKIERRRGVRLDIFKLDTFDQH